jgi:hypothetical protein
MTSCTIIPALTAAVPMGGVWLTDGTVVLWNSKIEAYEDQGDGSFEWIQRHASMIRFKAESVANGTNAPLGDFVNVTGAYYAYDGNLQPAPDYQNNPGFTP